MIELIEMAYDVKVFCAVSSYELHHYDDGSYIDIKVKKINDPRTLCNIVKNLEFKLVQDESNIIIRIFEDFKEY